jgi:Kef-type K+ transport system membrane component KefB
MPHLSFLPDFPLAMHPLLLFGVLLIAGVAGGELVHRAVRLPRITGYVLTGMVFGPEALGVLNEKLLIQSWIFVDIALGLVLFELGRRLHLRWLVRERYVLATGMLESALSFALVYGALMHFNVPSLQAAVAAAIGVSSSPAVVMLVARELRAEGQLTERALHLVAVNSVVAFTLTTMFLSWMHREYHADWVTVVLHPLYMLFGSLILGGLVCALALALARWIGKSAERQVVMLLGLVVFTIGAAHMLRLSVLFALLALGLLLRNLDTRHDIMSVDLGRTEQLFFVVLFVVTGARLALPQLAAGGAVALIFLAARFVGKSLGVLAIAPFAGARAGSAGLLCLALTPMSGLALALVHEASAVYPDFGADVAAILLSAILILELVGPLAVQFALRKSGEAERQEAA